MIEYKDIEVFYFVGIGGIGMSALARYFNKQGKKIYGFDRTSTALTNLLVSEGMDITFEDDPDRIPEEVKKNEKVLVIYTPAVSKSNRILNFFVSNDFKILKRAQLLGEISKQTTTLAVAGTHGKTTTSAILGHLLAENNLPMTAFLGGITENYQSNLIYKGDEISVVEADEFDRSFLQLRPDIACITSMDADHLDIYGEPEELKKAFREFAKTVPSADRLLIKNGLPLDGNTIGINIPSDYQVENIRIAEGNYVFDFKTPFGEIKDLVFSLPGHHNLMDAAFALGMALLIGVDGDSLKSALKSFKGVDRRFSYRIRSKSLVLIDDYAHHPTEIKSLFQAVDEMYPGEKKQIVFQPHLFSRTKDFADEFAESLSLFDEVILLEIYPAREEPIPGINSKWLLDKITVENKKLIGKSELGDALKSSSAKIKLMVGAGDIGAEVSKMKKILEDEKTA